MPVFDNPADQIVTEPPKSFQMKNNVLESLVREFFFHLHKLYCDIYQDMKLSSERLYTSPRPVQTICIQSINKQRGPRLFRYRFEIILSWFSLGCVLFCLRLVREIFCLAPSCMFVITQACEWRR